MTHSKKFHPVNAPCKEIPVVDEHIQALSEYSANDQKYEFAKEDMEHSTLDIPMDIGVVFENGESTDTAAQQKYSDLTKEQQRKVVTEYIKGNVDDLLGMSSTDMGQLVDRKASENFQG